MPLRRDAPLRSLWAAGPQRWFRLPLVTGRPTGTAFSISPWPLDSPVPSGENVHSASSTTEPHGDDASEPSTGSNPSSSSTLFGAVANNFDSPWKAHRTVTTPPPSRRGDSAFTPAPQLIWLPSKTTAPSSDSVPDPKDLAIAIPSDLDDVVTRVYQSRAAAYTPEEHARRRDHWEMLCRVVAQSLPDAATASVAPFGSTVTTLYTPNERLHYDLVLEPQSAGKEAEAALKRICASCPSLYPMQVSRSNRNPILRKVGAAEDSFDFSIGFRPSAVAGSHHLRSVFLEHSVVRLLAMLIQAWADIHIRRVSPGCLSSYALNLMLLHFLARQGVIPPPSTPSSQDPGQPPSFPPFVGFDHESIQWDEVKRLLPLFFSFYAWWSPEYVVSSDPDVPKRPPGWRSGPALCVEDPLEPGINAVETLTHAHWEHASAAFKTAASGDLDVALSLSPPLHSERSRPPSVRPHNAKPPSEHQDPVLHPETAATDASSVVIVPRTDDKGIRPGKVAPEPNANSALNPGESLPAAKSTSDEHPRQALPPAAALLRSLYARTLPRQDVYAHRQQEFCRLQDVVKHTMGDDTRLMVFGSSVTGLYTAATDLDLAAIVRPPPVDRTGAVRVLKQLLPALQRFRSIKLIDARTPILKKVRAPKGFPYDFDISCQHDGVINSYWLRRYVLDYPIVRPLAMLLKEWASVWELNSGMKGRLNSYALNLMLLHFLCKQKIIRYLPPEPVDLASLESFPDFIAFSEDNIPWTDIHDHLCAFFDFYSSWNEDHVVSLSSNPRKRTVLKTEKGWENLPLCVEDPFIVDFNTMLNVTPAVWKTISKCFHLGKKYARRNPEKLFRRPAGDNPWKELEQHWRPRNQSERRQHFVRSRAEAPARHQVDRQRSSAFDLEYVDDEDEEGADLVKSALAQ